VTEKADKPTLLAAFLQAGFPSPGEDLEGSPLDTNELLVRNPAATFFMRVSGQSMRDAGIYEGDIVVIDKSITPKNGDTVVAIINGDYTLKKLITGKGKAPRLAPANTDFDTFEASGNDEMTIWGVVTFVIRSVH
jgi:DNA polymerase V